MAGEAEIVKLADGGDRVELRCPTSMPRASGFLWNRRMLLQANCQGYATAQHLQPEPAKYSHAPVMELKTFMQPEQPYYAHHPGRFVYVRDELGSTMFSAPFAPVKRRPASFVFSVGEADIAWRVVENDIAVELAVLLPVDDVVELWTVTVANRGSRARALSVYPVFTIGYMSWMNQSARHEPGLGAIVAASVTPYQKLEDYAAIKALKDRTFLLHEYPPDAWETSLSALEGNGGLHAPEALEAPLLAGGEALYETPVAALQYRLRLGPGEGRTLRFAFGPAATDDDIRALRARYLCADGFAAAKRRVDEYLQERRPCAVLATPDAHFDTFVNRFLGRQVLYHGDTHRLTTDPQTRNFLQDNMGMVYVEPARAREALLTTLAQQQADGNLPEGIVLTPGGGLKYINQVPHTDHCVWLPVFLEAWLDETGDYALLDAHVPGAARTTVFDAVTAAMRWLKANRDARGLSLIAQGDWCDPMNMVGPAGKGVSGWLTVATVHALRLWVRVCRVRGNYDVAAELREVADESAAAAQEHLWDGDWFARGISDSGERFGVASDAEGRLFLNPQSWAILAGIARDDQVTRMLNAVDEHLASPWGTVLLAPAYTSMHEHIGRITQKFPGTAENGSVYNHAAAFWIAALYALGRADRAWTELRRAVPGPDPDDYLRRGQLPVYLPNYYRGASRQFPQAAGRSSHLFHTGAASWFYRLVIERLFGLRGCPDGLCVRPQLPSHWRSATVRRRFRGAEFEVVYLVDERAGETRLCIDGRPLADDVVRDFAAGRRYRLDVTVPPAVGATGRAERAASRVS
ncbi:MAG TPA: NdvB protein [Woeseiaceae bacterium]|nr:NdvB protein [Woeseiaceae bacterium]